MSSGDWDSFIMFASISVLSVVLLSLRSVCPRKNMFPDRQPGNNIQHRKREELRKRDLSLFLANYPYVSSPILRLFCAFPNVVGDLLGGFQKLSRFAVRIG